MCALLKYIFFDFANEATLKDKTIVARFFARLVEDGEFHPVEEPDASPERVGQLWDNTLKMRPKNAWIAFTNSAGFTITFGVYPGQWQRWYAMIYASAISNPDTENHVRSLLKTCELVCTILQPEYGCGLISLEDSSIASPGENTLSAVYDYNFFSPALVEKLGRDKIKTVPASRIAEYENGGMSVEMSPHPLVNYKAYTANYLKAAQILGISKYVQGA